MDEKINAEEEKLANHMKKLSTEEREKQGLVMLAYLQGYEAGYQASKLESSKKK